MMSLQGAEFLAGHQRPDQSAPKLQHQDSIRKRFQVTPAEDNTNRDVVEALNDSAGGSHNCSISGISVSTTRIYELQLLNSCNFWHYLSYCFAQSNLRPV